MSPRLALPDFSRLTVAVAGDLIADLTLACEPRGLSREAPVMVLRHVEEWLGAGGAANVARNARALGARTIVLGCVGRDARGRDLIEILEREGIDVSGLEALSGWTTPTKTRVTAAEPRRHPQQVLRIDREPALPADEGARRRVASRAREICRDVDALIVSDYEYGAVDGALGQAAIEAARAGRIAVLDPRRRLEGFEGVTAITPNVGELARFARVDAERLAQPSELARAARTLAGVSRWLLVTRGNLGMALYGEGCGDEGTLVEASGSGNVTDVSGAGDTAAAVFALSLAAGLDAAQAMQVGNAASGVVVMENGAVPCPLGALREALPRSPPPVRLVPGLLFDRRPGRPVE